MRLTVIAFIFLISQTVFAGQNYAIILGGAAHEKKNEFLPMMSSTADSFVQRGWKTTVLFDSDFDPKEWQQFPAAVRPTVPGEEAHQFKLSNFESSIDKILKSKPGPGDQLEIAFTAHGGNYPSVGHKIDWHDMRRHGTAAQIGLSLLDIFTPTSSLFKKIEELLKAGVRVHLNTVSCYDGQILNDIKPLLNKYPQLLCVTTSTASDRPSRAFDFPLYNSVFTSKVPISVFDAFKSGQKKENQISSIPDWMKVLEKSVSDLREGQIDRNRADVGLALCELQNEPAIRPIVLNELREITNYIDARTSRDTQAMLQKIITACSDESSSKLWKEYSDRYMALDQKYKAEPIIFRYSDAPDLFHFKTEQYPFGVVPMCSIRTSRASGWASYPVSGKNCENYATRFRVSDAVEMLLQDDGKLSERDKHGLEMFRVFLKKNTKFERVTTELMKQQKVLKEEYDRKKCDETTLERVLKEIKNSQLEKNRGTQPAKACEDFKI